MNVNTGPHPSPADETVTSIDIADFDIDDLDLSPSPSSVNDYLDTPFVAVAGPHLVVGYLVDDGDADNPLENDDGLGHIHSSHNDAPKEEHAAMQRALGLDDDWQPDFTRFQQAALDSLSAALPIDRVQDLCTRWDARRAKQAMETWSSRQLLAEALRDEAFVEGFIAQDSALSSLIADKAKELWRKARAAGGAGDPDAVLLDCYRHGSTHWSVSGEGMQCQFDTARGAGVWVPSECARESLIYEAIKGLLPEGTKVEYRSEGAKINSPTYVLPDGRAQGGFPDFVTAIRAAVDALGVTIDAEELCQRRRQVAMRYARQACETYTSWLNGETYGYVVTTFRNVADPADAPEWEEVDSDSCYGYIGTEDALAECRSAFDSEVRRRTKIPEPGSN